MAIRAIPINGIRSSGVYRAGDRIARERDARSTSTRGIPMAMS